MLPGARRRARNSSSNGVLSGSVWETRMKMDEVQGGIKVFNADNKDNTNEEEGIKVYRRLRRNQSDGAANADRRKRRNWKPPEPVTTNAAAAAAAPIQLMKARSEITSSPRICGGGDEDEDEDDEIEIEGEVKDFDDKEIVVHKIVEEKRIDEDFEKKKPSSPEAAVVQIPVVDLKKLDPEPVKPMPMEVEEDEEMIEINEIGSENTKRMQSLVDLVMWRDISKSAFIFGFGSFLLLSSSYTKDLDFSVMSAASYLGLVYLALIFLYRSILRRGVAEIEERCIIGEEEAVWALRILLPYINEILLKTKALFSGDPATTMKMAVLLFAMARCGGCITFWTLAKLVFFGVFTVPKILSSYSVQLARYGKFWFERFRDGWDSCSHKKAVAAAIFTIIWNISSTVARIWAVFMLVMAVKLYQQCAVEWNVEDHQQEEEEEEEIEVAEVQGKRQEDSITTTRKFTPAGNNNIKTRLHNSHKPPTGRAAVTTGKGKVKKGTRRKEE